MALQVRKHLVVNIVSHNRIADAVKLVLRIIGVLKLLCRLVYAKQVKRMDMLSGYNGLLWKLIFHKRRHGLKHAPGSRDADFCQLFPDLVFQLFFDNRDRTPDPADIMDLPVQHRPCLMLHRILRDNDKFLVLFISNRTYHIARTDIQSEYVLQLLFL